MRGFFDLGKGLANEIRQDYLRVYRELGRRPSRLEYLSRGRFKEESVRATFGGWTQFIQAVGKTSPAQPMDEPGRKPRVLVFDIECAPILAYVWKIWDENVGTNQITRDWHTLSWAAKWLGEPRIFYMDQRGKRRIDDDAEIMRGLWELLNEADVVVTQNGKRFDSKKVNTRFLMQGLPPPSPYKHIDTLQLAKKHFSFTSNKLDFLADALGLANKKMKPKKFVGFDLWRACLEGRREAFEEMERYNKADVLATEDLYRKLAPWGSTGVDLNVFYGDAVFRCQCGSTDLIKNGHAFTAQGKYQRFQCRSCGAFVSSKGAGNNLFSDKKKLSLRNPRGGA